MIKRDLFIVVADLDAENVMKTLLKHRQAALKVHVDFAEGDLLRYSRHDGGCCKDAVDLLRSRQNTHHHAMIIFDHHGSGAEEEPPTVIESRLEKQIMASGWALGAAAAVVLAPELETWVWSGSPHVAKILGWGNGPVAMKEYLSGAGLWPADASKPPDPKRAMGAAVREKGLPLVSGLFSDLAKHVSVDGCVDRSFLRFRKLLRSWFPK